MSIKKRDYLTLIIVVATLIAIPFFLNWILQRSAVVPVVGDSMTWLMFWGTYIGAILTALMVFATFITIRKTEKINKAQWRIAWLNNYRNIASDMVTAIDTTLLGQIAQDVTFGHYDVAVENGHAMVRAVNRSSFMLSSILKEGSHVFDAPIGDKNMDKVNAIIEPIVKCIGEIVQFSIVCKYLNGKINTNRKNEGVVAVAAMINEMKDAGYSVIVKAIEDIQKGNDIDNSIHDAVITMQQRIANYDTGKLEKLLLEIIKIQSKKAYSFSFMMVNTNGVAKAR